MLQYSTNSMSILTAADTDVHFTVRRARSAYIPSSRFDVDDLDLDEPWAEVYRKAGIDVRALRLENGYNEVDLSMELSGSRLDLCKRPATAGQSPTVQVITPFTRSSDRNRCDGQWQEKTKGQTDEKSEIRSLPTEHGKPSTTIKEGRAESSVVAADDGPSYTSELIQSGTTSTRLGLDEAFFDDISGWGEEADEETVVMTLGGASYQYLKCEGANQAAEPSADVVRKLKKLRIRKRNSQMPARTTKGSERTRKRHTKSRFGGCGEDEDVPGECDETDMAVSEQNMENGSTRTLRSNNQGAEAAQPERAPTDIPVTAASSIPSKHTTRAQSVAIEHVPLNAASPMVPGSVNSSRPTTCKRSPLRHLAALEPTVFPPASKSMAELRRKLLSSARTNNRNIGVPHDTSASGTSASPESAQQPIDKASTTRPTSSIPTVITPASSLGLAIVTGKRYCANTLTPVTASTPTIMSIHDKRPASRRWCSSNSISEPQTLPQQAPTASLPPLMIGPKRPTTASYSCADDAEGSEQPSLLSASTSSIGPPSQIPKWFATKSDEKYYRSATLDKFMAALGTSDNAPLTVQLQHQRQADGPRHSLIRRPARKLSQSGFLAVSFWDGSAADSLDNEQAAFGRSAEPELAALDPERLTNRSFHDHISRTRTCVT